MWLLIHSQSILGPDGQSPHTSDAVVRSVTRLLSCLAKFYNGLYSGSESDRFKNLADFIPSALDVQHVRCVLIFQEDPYLPDYLMQSHYPHFLPRN